MDLAIATAFNIDVLLGDGTGGFGDLQSYYGQYSSEIVVGDFNNDENLDLGVTNQLDDTVSTLLGDGAGGFGEPLNYYLGGGYAPWGIVVADFDGDENLDVAVANEYHFSMSVLYGDGSGGLEVIYMRKPA